MVREFFIVKLSPRKVVDSDRFEQTTLQARLSEAVARREYLQRYAIPVEVDHD